MIEADAELLQPTQADGVLGDGPLVAAGGTQPADATVAASGEMAAAAAVASSGRASRAMAHGGTGGGTAGGGTAGGGTAVGSARLTKGWAAVRLASVSAKLRGGNSAHLTLRDLESSTNAELKKADTMAALRDIVLGPDDSLRRRLPELGLTVEEQVDVLVEQATDLNIVGRTYQGWAPFL